MKKKILIFNWWDIKNPKAGGAEVHLTEIFSRLAWDGYSVTLVCSNFRTGKKEELLNGIRIKRIAPWWLINIATFFWYLRNGNQFELIVDYTNKIPYLTPLYIRRKPLLAMALHVFGDIWREEWGVVGAIFSLLEKMFYFCYRKTPTVAISKSTKDELAKMRVSRVKVIYPGVNLPGVRKTAKSIFPTALYLGRLKKYKRVDLLIEVWPKVLKKFPSAELWILGSGSDRPRLERLADIKNIKFLGYLSDSKKNKYLQKAWLLVQPSVKEGWGLTVLEAAVAGTPSLVSESPGLVEVVKKGETGWFFRKNKNDLSCQIIEIFSSNKIRKNFSDEAQKYGRKFSWDISSKKLERLIEGL